MLNPTCCMRIIHPAWQKTLATPLLAPKNNLMKRIAGFVIAIFTKLQSLLARANQQSNHSNIKAIATVGCLVLLVLFVMAIFRKREVQPVLSRAS